MAVGFRFRLHSSDNLARLGADLTGKYLDAMPYSQTREMVRQHVEMAIEQRRPVATVREGSFSDSDGRVWRYEVLVLPFSRDGEKIDMPMSTVLWHQRQGKGKGKMALLYRLMKGGGTGAPR